MFKKLPQAIPFFQKLVVSCEITRQHLLEWGMPAEKMVKIPIGVDLPRFSPATSAERQHIRAELGIPENAVCIGSFQKDGEGWGEGLSPKLIKGPDVFLDVVAALAARYPTLMVLLTGPSRGYVKQGLEKIGIPYIHHFLENPADIGRYYQALDAYLIASRIEGGPIALMESWASGVPVVSTRMGMAADWIQPGENGLLADVEDVPALAENLHRVLQAADLRQKLIQNGLETVKLLDWACIAEQYDQLLYEPILGKT
jgi:glycosyltransferase involved in cell wall biosynthesis